MQGSQHFNPTDCTHEAGSSCTFLPLLRPYIIMELVRRSTIGH
jgi:hypothetical protein